MMRRPALVLALGAAACAAPPSEPTVASLRPAPSLTEVVVPALDEASLPAWRDHILPAPDELAWASIPWLPSYREGLLAAQSQRKPLMLWMMNGHPLGCT
jgi:hypothetical protein